MANGTIAASQLEMLSLSGTGIITITPPGDHTEFKSTDWSFVLEITPQDGYYDAQFQLDGTITDSGATF